MSAGGADHSLLEGPCAQPPSCSRDPLRPGLRTATSPRGRNGRWMHGKGLSPAGTCPPGPARPQNEEGAAVLAITRTAIRRSRLVDGLAEPQYSPLPRCRDARSGRPVCPHEPPVKGILGGSAGADFQSLPRAYPWSGTANPVRNPHCGRAPHRDSRADGLGWHFLPPAPRHVAPPATGGLRGPPGPARRRSGPGTYVPQVGRCLQR